MKRKRNDSKENLEKVVKTCLRHKIDDQNAFRESLLSWYDASCRTLPWRTAAKEEEDPDIRGYRVWVSEVMLQQTQVATVIQYYNNWMSKWPTVRDLALASLEAVQEAWSGLGYYSRARRLHEAANHVVEKLGGAMPRTSETLLQLPGVGRYTAAAVASIAYGQVTGLVDGNVSRVVSRVTRVGKDIASGHVTEFLWDTVNNLVDSTRPGEFNQAMMELGATVCTPRAPSCSTCPVRGQCGAKNHLQRVKEPDIEECDLCLPGQDYNQDLGVMNYPRKAKKTASRDQETLVVVVKKLFGSEIRFLLERRPSKGLLANLLQFPSVELTQGREIKESEKIKLIQDHLESLNIQSSSPIKVDSVLHVFSHINMTYSVYTSEARDDQEKSTEGPQWLTEKEFESCGTSTAMRKVFKCLDEKKKPVKKMRTQQIKTDKQQPKLLSFFKVKNEKK